MISGGRPSAAEVVQHRGVCNPIKPAVITLPLSKCCMCECNLAIRDHLSELRLEPGTTGDAYTAYLNQVGSYCTCVPKFQ